MEKTRNFHSCKRLCSESLKIMKLTFIFLLVGLMTVNAKSFSQTSNLNLKLSNRTLSDVFEEIERQSDYYFIFKDGQLDVTKKVSINIENSSINDVLEELLDGTNMGYQFVDRYIVIGKTDRPTNSKQLPQKVTGTVTDGEGVPLPGVTVVIQGTTMGAITDFDGKYQLNVSSGDVLVFSFVGMAPQEFVYAGEETLDVTLQPDQLQVEEVVVTALGIRREKKALGYSVQDVKADELTQTGDANLVSSLQGKVAGVQINQSGGGLGGTSRIEIRGASSLSDNNQPLWVVDGVPFHNENLPNEGSQRNGSIWGGTSRAGGAFDLNPEDIESVSVLKGANAAALYGERGGNGVILVTTKKGSRSKGLGINYSGTVTVSEAAYMLDLQERYGSGSEGVYDPRGKSSWGPLMEGQMLESWTGETIPYELEKDRLKDFTRTGLTHKHNVAVTGGNEEGTFRVSVGKDILNGIYEDHKVEKLTFDLRADYDISDWLNVDAKVSFFKTEGNERPEIGNYSYVSYFNSMPMNIRNQDLAPGYELIGGQHVEKLYTTANADFRNPFFLQEQTTNSDEKNRTFGYLAANIKILPELKAKFKYGMDFYQFSAIEGYLYADNVDANRPNYNPSQSDFKEENYEFLLSYNKDLNEDFTLGLSFGANNMTRSYYELRAASGRLTSEGDFFLAAGANINASERTTESEVRSVYGFGQLAYKSTLFLDATFRNDWSSTLTASDTEFDNSYLYPSVTLSGIVSEMVELPEWISFAKIRGSWAQVGKATNPYETSQNFTISSWNYRLSVGNLAANELGEIIKVIEDLKPEISTSWEIGADLKFFNNRLGVDFTYYNEETKNQILAVPTVESSGFAKRLINAGLITNKGFEVMLNTTPVRTRDLNVNLDFNFAKNEGVLEELAEGVPEYLFGLGVKGIPGEKLGLITGSIYDRNANGDIIVDENGLMTTAQGNDHIIGNIQPDWTGSVNLSVDYKGLYMSTLVSIQQGGDILSSSERGAVASGTAARTDVNNRIDFFVDGVTADGNVNTTMVSAEEYWRKLAQIDEEFIYDASHMKLKELAIGYNVPKSVLAKIKHNPIRSMRLSLVGRNLLYFYKDTPGTAPDASAYSSAYEAQAFDFAPVPTTRTFGFSLHVGF